MNELDEEKTNEIIELNSEENLDVETKEEDNNLESDMIFKDEPETKLKKNKFLHNLSKKKKIIIIIIGLVIILLGVFLVYYFIFKKEKVNNPEQVIVQKENYRYENGKLVFLDENKNVLGEYECQNKDEKLCYVSYYTNENELDKEKILYDDNTEYMYRTPIFANNFVFINDLKDDVIILYNIKTKTIDGEYNSVKRYKDNSVIVSQNEQYGLIDINEDKASTMIDLKYNYLGYFGFDDNLIFNDTNGYGIMSVAGKKIASKIKYDIKSYNDKYIAVFDQGNYLLYTYDGKLTDMPDADYIYFFEDFIASVKDQQLSIYNSDLIALNLDTIGLTNKDYIITKIVDKNGKLKETRSAFNLTNNEDNIRVDYNNEYIILNKYEAIINGKLDYVSYNNGKLYFYNEADKQTLIGTYTCENENKLSKDSTTFENCFIASESKLLNRNNTDDYMGYIPIYNNRFVFIADNKSLSVDNQIKLWDLKDNKNISTYSKVDVGYYQYSTNISSASTNNILIMAQKSNGYYGVFTINDNAVQAIIRFDANATEIRYLNDFLLVRKNDDTYHLYKTDGTEITTNINTHSEIIELKSIYLKVKNNEEYQIYNIETGKIISASYKYIAMADNYYVAIDKDNKLNIYTYSSDKLLCKDVLLLDTDNLASAYKVVYYNNNAISVTVKNSDGTTADIYEFGQNSCTSKNEPCVCE